MFEFILEMLGSWGVEWTAESASAAAGEPWGGASELTEGAELIVPLLVLERGEDSEQLQDAPAVEGLRSLTEPDTE